MPKKILLITALALFVCGCGSKEAMMTTDDLLTALRDKGVEVGNIYAFSSDTMMQQVESKYQAKIISVKLDGITTKVYECKSVERAKWVVDMENRGSSLVTTDDFEIFTRKNNLLLSVPRKDQDDPDYKYVLKIFNEL